MQPYEYSGQLRGGSAIAGTLEAASNAEARKQLEEMGVSVTSVNDAARMPPRRPLSADDFQFFNEQLASLASTRLALEPGLRMMAREVRSGRLRRLCAQLADEVAGGDSLPGAIARHGKAFPPLYAEIVQAGMESGRLGATLYNLNTHLRLMGQTRRAVWEIAGYPLIVLVLAFCILTLFFTWLVPQMQAVFDDFGIALPGLTTFVLGIARAWPVVLVVTGVFVVVTGLLMTAMRWTPGGRAVRERILLALPGLGGVYRDGMLARFSRGAALTSASGLPLPRILRLASGATGSPILQREADACAKTIEGGGSLTQATLKTRFIPAMLGYLIDTAGPRGDLTPALHDLARTYDEQAYHRLALVRIFLFPMFIFILGTVIFLFTIAMISPLVSLVNSLTGS